MQHRGCGYRRGMYLDGLASCAELTTPHVDEASASSTAMRALLVWAARVARPGEGAPKLLLAFARLPHAEWVEGTPYVEITGDSRQTAISIFTAHGMGIRERMFPRVQLAVPIDEFARAVRLAPHLVAPLRVSAMQNGVLLAPAELADDAPPSRDEARIGSQEAIAIDQRSLHEQERKTAPPPPVPVTDHSGIHTRPTVRRMVAVDPEALRRRKDED